MVQQMRKIKNRRGMTMAEVLIVIAIISVLAGVAFIAVMNYLRSMAQLERDGIAKEIFVAAQNNLTAAKGEGYLGIGGEGGTGYGTPGDWTDGEKADADNDVYYYVVNAGAVSGSGDEIFPLMLPFGAIDETVRMGGSYLIRYQRSSGLVLDVFYTTTKASHARFNHTLTVEEYKDLMGVTGSKKKSDRRTYTDKSVIGWYGGTDAEELANITLEPPVIEVVNAEKLYVNVTDPNAGKEGAALRLIITGTLSGVSHYINVTDPTQPVVLDDITTAGGHFAERSFDDMPIGTTENGFIPGEDIVIKAVAYSTSALANISYSAEKTTNSLYGSVSDSDGDGKPDTAGIGNIRHLENLDRTVSKLGTNDTAVLDEKRKINIAAAVQTDDLSWKSFAAAIGGETVQIHQCDDRTGTKAGCFFPVSPDYLLAYDGQNHSISDIQIDHAGDAGLFGEITEAGSSISNLELKDFSVTGTTNAGALAGTLSGTNVTNVIVRNTENDLAATDVTASSGSAGGLIGSATGGKFTACGAALTVNGTTAAGGLIGTAAGTADIKACYAAGQTEQGEYYKHKADGSRDQELWNVKTGDSGTAGGLVGIAGDTQIAASYSTCSVSGSTAGGFIGTASADGSINTCYCTGLVSGTTDNAFIGSTTAGTPELTGDNYYFSIINEIITTDDDGNITAITYKEPGLAGVTAIDADAAAYNTFSGSSATWDQAAAYDPELVKYYSGKYNLETVYSLYNKAYNNSLTEGLFAAVHYGDWPAPEIMIENTAQ